MCWSLKIFLTICLKLVVGRTFDCSLLTPCVLRSHFSLTFLEAQMWRSCIFSIAVQEELLSVGKMLQSHFPSMCMSVSVTHCRAVHNMLPVLIFQHPRELSIAIWLPFYKWGNWGSERLSTKTIQDILFLPQQINFIIFPFERERERENESKINSGPLHLYSTLEISLYFSSPLCVMCVLQCSLED